MNSMSNLSTISLPGQTSDISTTTKNPGEEQLRKRTTLKRPHSAYVSPSTQLALDTARIKRLATDKPNTTADKHTASFAPMSQARFLERLKTFSQSVAQWSIKPDIMNEVEWAKRGWRLVGKETVSCTTCAKRVVINYSINEPENTAEGLGTQEEEDQWKEKALEELAEKYGKLIVSAHYDDCLWKGYGCSGMCWP